MPNLYIRIPDALHRALRMKALHEQKTLAELVVPALELIVNSNPIEYVHGPGYTEEV